MKGPPNEELLFSPLDSFVQSMKKLFVLFFNAVAVGVQVLIFFLTFWLNKTL